MRSEKVCRFGSLTVVYDDTCLTPRPWTILQSDWGVELAASLPPGPILELCAGVGHIGLDVAVRTGRPLVQIEAEIHAAMFARRNAADAGVLAYEMRRSPVETGVQNGEQFALVLADPPYIPSDEIGAFPRDPSVAIDGGDDGLRVARACLAVAQTNLMPSGALLLQTRGPRQAFDVESSLPFGLVAKETRVVDDERAVLLVTRSD